MRVGEGKASAGLKIPELLHISGRKEITSGYLIFLPGFPSLSRV